MASAVRQADYSDLATIEGVWELNLSHGSRSDVVKSYVAKTLVISKFVPDAAN